MTIEDTYRATRDAKLSASDNDMMKLLDAATSWADFNTKRTALNTYRAALRDLPASFPEDMDGSNLPDMPLSPAQQAIVDGD